MNHFNHDNFNLNRKLGDFGFHNPLSNDLAFKSKDINKIMEKWKKMENTNKPVKIIRVGGITATIWSNIIKKDNIEFESFTINIERNYAKEENNETKWYKTSSMRLNDLPDVELATRKAYEFLKIENKQK